ncbi:Small basic protein [Candidatus Fervidibacteria bacterium JGI MDM2 SSWTFF-3-K9]
MWLGFLALLIGLLLGLWLPTLAILPANLQQQLPNYSGLALLAAIDATLGAWRASMEGTYDTGVFLSGFFVNMIAAASLAYIGDLIGVNLALAAVVAFGTRIFNNLAAIRRILLQQWRQRMTRVG